VAVGAGVLRFTPDQVRAMSVAEFNLAVEAYVDSQPRGRNAAGGGGPDLADDDVDEMLQFLEENRDV
jgi:hypothetical protein